MKTWILLKDGEVRATMQALTKPPIAASKGEYFETVNSDPPEFNPETQKLIESWAVKWGKYRQEWEVVDKTPLELWHYPEYCKRIIAPFSLISDPSMVGIIMKTRFDLDGLPMVREGGTVYIYAKEILPEDQAIVDQLQGVITIEDKPE